MLSANEAIQIIGQRLIPDFLLEEPVMVSFYEKVFNVIVEGLDIDNKRARSVLIIGDKGVGKSACMRVMGTLFKDTDRKFRYVKSYDLISMLDIMKPALIKDQYGAACKCDLYIDDIGLGQAVKNEYGNHINLISELIMERYDLFLSEGYKTHFSSNRLFNVDRSKYPNVSKTIMEMYGDVVCDRLIEMTEIIRWQGQSLRRQAV